MQCSDGSIGKPGKGLAKILQCLRRCAKIDTDNSPCDQLFTRLVSCLLTWLTLSVCPPVSVMLFINLATQNLRTHRSSSRSSMLSLLRTTDRASGQLHGLREQQGGEEVLVQSDHPCSRSSNKRLTSCPQLTSHDRTLDDASFSSGRQTEKKCPEAAIARPPVSRTLEQSEIRNSNFRVLAPSRT